jgi:nucleoside-diphosphate-sugar epimerase
MTNLASKKVLIIGGSGYLGGYLARTLSLHGATVSSLSRRGPRSIHPQNKDINWIIGSAMDAKNYKKEINEVDMVVHSVGTLVDTTITKGMKPGDPGSYEQVNRDSFLRVLEQIDTPKKVVYVSANGRPPYLHRY